MIRLLIELILIASLLGYTMYHRITEGQAPFLLILFALFGLFRLIVILPKMSNNFKNHICNKF